MPDRAKLVELREELHTKQKTLAEAFDLAKDGKGFDFSRAKVLEKLGAADLTDAMAKVKERNNELADLGRRLSAAEMTAAYEDVTELGEDLKHPTATRHPGASQDTKTKTWGQRIAERKDWKDARTNRVEWRGEIEDVGLKTLFQTTAGFPPESVRSGLLVEGATRPIQVTDLIPAFPIEQQNFVYMREDTRTHAAAERAEAAAYAESTFVWSQQTSPVRSIGDSIPATDEQLADEPQARSILETRLSFGVRQRLDGQILVGNGTPPNLRGINNTAGIGVQALGTDPRITGFLRALNLVRFTGRAIPNGAVFHPNDWLEILLSQDASGEYLFGNPFQGPGPQSLFGVPIAQSDAQTENTGLVGDFMTFSRLDERRGVNVQVGYVGNQFTLGQVTIRADIRVAFTVTRPAAFVQLTGI